MFSASFVILTSFFDLRSYSNALIESKKELAEELGKKRDIEQMDNLSELETRTRNLNSLLVDGERPVDEILFMEELVDSYGLTVDIDVQRNQSSVLTGDSCLLFSLGISGSLSNLLEFMEDVENGNRVAAITDWKISFDENSDGVRANLNVEVFTSQSDE